MDSQHNLPRPVRALPQPACFADLVFLLPLPPVASNRTRFADGEGEKIQEPTR